MLICPSCQGQTRKSLNLENDMFTIRKQEIVLGGRPLIIETGKIARQADGAVIVTYGATQVLATVCAARQPYADADFLPLSVHYQEKAAAAGKIPGGFFKREARPSEKEILTSRLIDRSIRPLFSKSFFNETQLICVLLSHDMENDPDIVAMIAGSAAVALSGIPFAGPMGAARVGLIQDSFVLNPTLAQMAQSQLDLVVAGTRDGVLMVESQARELSEDRMLEAITFGHEQFSHVIHAVEDLVQSARTQPSWDHDEKTVDHDLMSRVESLSRDEIRSAYTETHKSDRKAKLAAIYQSVTTQLNQEGGEDRSDLISNVIQQIESQVVRTHILETGKRIDGRSPQEIRSIDCEIGILPRSHGSALFTRGETQALVIATLGTASDEQIVDALSGEYRERFLLHYNFPPYSVGETKRVGMPGRREIGHGKLAWRALQPLIPERESFPYTIRLLSEITESNGSSSMATVCGGTLALIDAGIPIERPVAGIAMGLIKEGDRFVVLSDILGDEDHFGDMDFKVAGTKQGITALQMDIKITSINAHIISDALAQAYEGRMHILETIIHAASEARGEISPHAPRVEQFTISKSRIRDVIGSGGKVIREICASTGAKIDIDDDGVVTVAAVESDALARAIKWVRSLTSDPEIGQLYDGKVVKIADFGAFVNFHGTRDGLVHISELSEARVRKTSDVVFTGKAVRVKVIGFDERGKIKLSMKGITQEGLEKDLSKAS